MKRADAVAYICKEYGISAAEASSFLSLIRSDEAEALDCKRMGLPYLKPDYSNLKDYLGWLERKAEEREGPLE